MRIFLCIVFLSLFFPSLFFAKDNVKINFQDLDTQSLIKIASKIVKKDILITTAIEGKVQYISNGTIDKKNILDILKCDLRSKGFSLIEKPNIFLVVKDEDLLRYDPNTKQKSPEVEVFPIKNVESKLILQVIQDILSSQKDFIKPSISLDEDNNRIVVYGFEKEIKIIQRIIQKLDTPQQQVYVEAKIIEISETKTENIGFQYGINGFYSSGSSFNTLSSSLNSPSAINTISLEQMSSYGYSPNILKSSIALGATINFLKQNKALEVVSEPSILCINNQESFIYVGETRSLPTGTTIGTTTTTNYKREDIGLRLSIKPRLSSNQKVTLDIRTIIEDIKLASAIDAIPHTNKKEVLTTAIVNNGENVIIGGLIKNKKESSQYKVPLLGDIPLLGTLFRSNYEYEDKVNLVIIITPYIVPKTEDLTYIEEQLTQLRAIENNYTATLYKELERLKNQNQNKNQNQKYHDKIVEDILDQ